MNNIYSQYQKQESVKRQWLAMISLLVPFFPFLVLVFNQSFIPPEWIEKIFDFTSKDYYYEIVKNWMIISQIYIIYEKIRYRVGFIGYSRTSVQLRKLTGAKDMPFYKNYEEYVTLKNLIAGCVPQFILIVIPSGKLA